MKQYIIIAPNLYGNPEDLDAKKYWIFKNFIPPFQ